MVFTNRKKLVNKIILFLKDRNSDSITQNEGFVKKIRFYYAEKLLLPVGICKKTRKRWFPIVGETLICKKSIHLKFNTGYH